ncbi:uncharacterized protein LOC143276191 [Babylonia areolata]|uniref:uncharacterized protein LOC143276191 n=1 Tax=Babylonia areolata TaxID=304850 RepID=UPI003FD54DD9
MALFGKSFLFTLCVAAVATSLNAASTTPPPTTATTATTTTTTNTTTTNTTAAATTNNNNNNTATTTNNSNTNNNNNNTTTTNNNSNTNNNNNNTTTNNNNNNNTNNTTTSTTSVSGNITDSSATANATTTVATTTAAPQPPFNCHDCNSGSPLPGYWRNTNCAEDGYVAQWYTPNSCSTFCFSSVGLYPAGTVFRGCATALYLPDRELQDGCFDDVTNNRHVCLCSGDDCNTHDLTSDSEAYVQEYVAMQQAGSDNTVY